MTHAEVDGRAEPGEFPLRRECPFAPPPEYERLRSEHPVARVRMRGGNEAWVVTRHRDVRRLLGDPTTSVDRRRPGFPRFVPATEDQRQDSYRGFRTPLNWMDPPEHTAVRRSVRDEFGWRRIEPLRPRIQQIVDQCLDAMLAGPRPVDLVRALALPVPSSAICELLGVPYAEHDYFEVRAIRMLDRAVSAEDRTTAAHELRSFLDHVVTEKEHRPGDDLLSRLIGTQRATTGLDHESVVSMAFVLLVAGHVTTASVISLGTVALLENPGQLTSLRDDPSRMPRAVEELLRYCSVVEAATARTALVDLEVGGVVIQAGEGVVAVGQTANHDPDRYAHPDELDIERGGRGHVAFGYGPHQCLGQNLARLELRVVFDTLLRRVPRLRLAGGIEEVRFNNDANIYGIHELPVTW
jgi:cytochrome P450